MTAVLAALGAGLLVVLGTAARLILENEYPSWASALARRLVGLAGWVHPRRRDEWVADILYLQRQGKTGLWEAGAYLVGAPWLTLRRFAIRATPTQVTWPEANVGGALVFALGAQLADRVGAGLAVLLTVMVGAGLGVVLADGLVFGVFVGLVFGLSRRAAPAEARAGLSREGAQA